MSRTRNLREVSDRGSKEPVRETQVEREARERWEQAALEEPYQPGEDIDAWSARIKARAAEIKAKTQWWEDA